uniref:2-methoxy-6-polyprenyl-1,4-benzoquinol methylase, mitochondrial n=1 Tax=Timema genevievae TaxID=629358 RepID=A0A7R9PNG5_TIMGE|nr:unnamed protein product [Timema genevievae]
MGSAILRSPLYYFQYIKNSHYTLSVRLYTPLRDEIKDASDKQTHFGFEKVNESDKAKKVYSVFENVAESYDTMNDAMSFGIHRIWKDIFIQRLAPSHDTQLLDVAGGTGDIAFRFLNYLRLSGDHINSSPKVTVCDINKSMLEVGKTRAKRLGLDGPCINWLQGDAECLHVEDNSYTAYTIAFGLRNVTRVDKAVKEAYRVLKPGGRFLCLEFSQVTSPQVRWIYDEYSFRVIPVLGQLIAGQWKPYQYLVESIRQFPPQEEFRDMIKSAGFQMVTYENLTFGVVAIHSGFKL